MLMMMTTIMAMVKKERFYVATRDKNIYYLALYRKNCLTVKLCIDFGCAASSLLGEAFLYSASEGCCSLQCTGFSCWGAQIPAAAVHRLSSCGVCLSCSEAWRIFLDQGSNCVLWIRRQFLSTVPPGNSYLEFLKTYYMRLISCNVLF